MKELKFLLVAVIGFAMVYVCAELSKSGSKDEIKFKVEGAEGKTYDSYQSACNAGDFNAAREIIAKMKEKTAAKAAEEYVLNEEIQYLAALNDEQANTKTILILNQSIDKGLEAAEGACLGKNISQADLNYKDYEDLLPSEIQSFKKYISWCGKHNMRCNTVLGIALATGNKSLAKSILHLFKDDPELSLKNHVKSRDDGDRWDVYAHYTNGSRVAAQKKYDEAVKAGAFKKE